MKITRQDVEYVAALAHLALSPEELERMQQQLDAILEYMDKLNELDTTNVPPMAQVLVPTKSGQAESRPDVAWRADATRSGLTHSEALANAPDTNQAFFKVPKVIER